MKPRRSPPARGPAPPAPPRFELPAWTVALAIALGLLVPLAMLVETRIAGTPLSFPLDDAWIHLQYARNLAEHGAFTYFPGDHTTAGSTAPLFTLIEALLWAISRNEIFTGLALGLAAHAGFLVVLAAWASRRLGSPGWAALAIALVALDGRFGLLAVSGMETSLFLLGLALAFLAWTRDDARGAGAAIGATVWVRPEALVLAGVFAIDALIARRLPRRTPAGLALLIALVGGYLGFNFVTGHTAFPNTLAAKAAYYGPIALATFVRRDVFATFSAGWIVMAAAAALAVVLELRRRLRGRREPGETSVLAETGWAIALVLSYAVVLRYSHRFNRYLVPALPALAIAGVAGLRAIAATGAKRSRLTAGAAVAIAAAILACALQVRALAPQMGEDAMWARYHLDRQVRTGRWLAEHTPKDAVVATHDVGAIAFYSGRRIVDMVGLVTPEVVPYLNRPDYVAFLGRLFDARGVNYLAVLDSWQPVDNEKPLFTADPNPEVMRVYAWRPGRTHLLDFAVAQSAGIASDALDQGRLDEAGRAVASALRADSGSALVWMLAGALADRTRRYPEAAEDYARAVRLFPESPEARTGYAGSLARLGRVAEARIQFDTLSTLDAKPEALRLVRRMIEAAEAGRR